MSVIMLVLLLSAASSHSAVFIVKDSENLRKALLTSQSKGEIDFIELAAGKYDPGKEPFTYTAEPSENFGLIISGAGIDETKLESSGESAVLIIDTIAVENDSAYM